MNFNEMFHEADLGAKSNGHLLYEFHHEQFFGLTILQLISVCTSGISLETPLCCVSMLFPKNQTNGLIQLKC
jgi:hypothetical protein